MIDFDCLYPPPDRFKYDDGSSRFAFMTFVMRNDSYVPGALVFAYALHKQATQADLVCMVTRNVTSPARAALEQLFDRVVEVDEIFIPHHRRQERQDRPFLFTRFQALRAGLDGDLGLKYEKVSLVDADVLPLRCYDHLFTLDPPAGIINESKSNCMEYDSAGKYVLPTSLPETGKWKWHDIYEPVCPHGGKIPARMTERVLTDPGNMGINSSLWVLKPSMSELDNLLEYARQPDIHRLVEQAFTWPEMQFATLYWSGQWTNIDLRFSSFNGYPQLSDVLCGTHFAGYKPWKFKETGTISRFSRFPDYALWQQGFLAMMADYPVLFKLPKLARLRSDIIAMPAV
jgi:alpha-N-acetylglucosamine transferase